VIDIEVEIFRNWPGRPHNGFRFDGNRLRAEAVSAGSSQMMKQSKAKVRNKNLKAHMANSSIDRREWRQHY
ncbi:MAG TPA: hypothetical protein VM574_08670, partial [Terrimicrobiaceae bacterium]|nr:hypothetical protein [Terrimicrobiaceae bacterium]